MSRADVSPPMVRPLLRWMFAELAKELRDTANASLQSWHGASWRRLERESASRPGALGRLDVIVADVGIQMLWAPFAKYRVKN